MNTQNTSRTTAYRHAATGRNMRTVRSADGRRKRRSVINNKLFRISFVAFLVLFICVAGILNITAEGSDANVQRQYKSVKIEDGDTLWSIALEYNDEALSNDSTEEYIEDIMSINNLVRDDKITEGNYIIVPVYVMEN